MSIDPNETAWVLARYDAELAADKGIAQATQEIDKAQPIIPSGGRAEAWVKPQVQRAESLRDRTRVWAPGIAGTGVAGVLLVGPIDVPLTGPLIAYGISWIGFGWWTAAGRPGPRDSSVLLVRGIAAAGRGIGVAAIATYGFIGKGAHAITTPMRRTAEAG
jgi:hypothetical protein